MYHARVAKKMDENNAAVEGLPPREPDSEEWLTASSGSEESEGFQVAVEGPTVVDQLSVLLDENMPTTVPAAQEGGAAEDLSYSVFLSAKGQTPANLPTTWVEVLRLCSCISHSRIPRAPIATTVKAHFLHFSGAIIAGMKY